MKEPFSIRSIDLSLHASPIRNPRFAVPVLFVLSILILISIAIFFRSLQGLSSQALLIFFSSLGGAIALSVIPISILWFLDRRERESPYLFLIAFLWGGVVATNLSLPFNTIVYQFVEAFVSDQADMFSFLGAAGARMIAAPLSGPLFEEFFKGLGVLLLFYLLRAEFDNSRDGFVYGALVGIGFNCFEVALYVLIGFLEWGFAPWEFQMGIRFSLFGLGKHAFFTGLFGLFLGLSRESPRKWLKYLFPVTGFFLAMSAHFLNNVVPLFTAWRRSQGDPNSNPSIPESLPPPDLSLMEAWIGGSVYDLLLMFPFLGVAYVLVWRSGRNERRVIEEELSDEIGSLVTTDEFFQIQEDGVFQTRRINSLDRRASLALVKAQNELAFRKRRVRLEGGNVETDEVIRHWRAIIARARSESKSEVEGLKASTSEFECSACHSPIQVGQTFCLFCGEEIEWSEEDIGHRHGGSRAELERRLRPITGGSEEERRVLLFLVVLGVAFFLNIVRLAIQ